MRLRSYMSYTYGIGMRAKGRRREQRGKRGTTKTHSSREGTGEYCVAGLSPRRGVERWMRGGQEQSQMRKQGHKRREGKERRKA